MRFRSFEVGRRSFEINDRTSENGITFRSTSETEPLVTLRYFGPEVNPDAPAMGAYRKNKFN